MTQTLVTGGCGFVGQHLVEALLARGRKVRVLDLRPPKNGAAGVHFMKGSILDPTSVREALSGVDEVYHLAALPGMWMPSKTSFHAVNYYGTEVVLEAARESRVSRFLHCSTESILFSPGDRTSPITEEVVTTPDMMPGAYTRSKSYAEQRAFSAAGSGFPIVIANPTMPIGPYQGKATPPAMMVQHFLTRRVQCYLDFTVNLVDVRDVAEGLLLVMEKGLPGNRYILGGENMSLTKLLTIIQTISGKRAFRIPIHSSLALATAAGMEFVADYFSRQPPTATVEGVRIALRSKPISIEKARRELGYSPRPIEGALRETIDSILKRLQGTQ